MATLPTPPNAIEAEQAVLGGLLLAPESLDRIDWLDHSAFYRSEHRAIYAALRRVIESGQTVDALLLCDELSRRGELETVGGQAYIGSLAINTPSAANIQKYAEIVRDKAALRALQGVASDVLSSAGELGADAQALIEQAAARFDSLKRVDQGSEEVSFAQLVGDAMDERDKPKRAIPTGFNNLDQRLTGGGFKPGQLIVIAGRPSMGKSALAFNIAEHVAKTVTVACFSLEMTGIEIAERSIVHHESAVGIDEAVRHLMTDVKSFVIDAPAITVANIRTRCRRIQRKHGLGLIVVDYIQLMRGAGENRTQEVGSISRGLKAVAKEFSVPVVAVAQINRAVELRTDKRPQLSDLRDSGEIEQDADVVLMAYRDEFYNPNNTTALGLAEVLIRKQRNGATGTTWLTFTPATTRFGNFHGEAPQAPSVARRPTFGKLASTDFKTRAAGDDQ
jgi:replicative DNA helicase